MRYPMGPMAYQGLYNGMIGRNALRFMNQMSDWRGRGLRAAGPSVGLGFGFLEMGFGFVDPTADRIASSPTAGMWYQIKRGDTYWAASKAAYGRENVKKGLYLMNDSPWNSYIDKARKGWEAYRVDGLQATPHYNSARARAPKGSGNDYPLVWIPPITGGDPEEISPVDPIIGPIGPPGPAGARGPIGARGPSGGRGPIGPPGQGAGDSVPGPRGPIGPPGGLGPIGPPGSRGSAGDRGPIGPPGQGAGDPVPGPRGPAGARGSVGPPGRLGPIGPPGSLGPIGPPGGLGPIGPPGPAGPTGQGGGGSDKKMWVIPLVGLLASLKGG